MKHMVALSGSYYGSDVENLFKNLSHNGILQMSLVGREITLQIRSENLDDIKRSLNKLGVSNVNILEWRKTGVTLSNPGKGTNNDKTFKVSLIPSALDGEIHPLAFLCEFDVDEKILERIKSKIEDILTDAGITDAMYTVYIKKELVEEEYLNSATMAVLNAIFDSGGVVGIE